MRRYLAAFFSTLAAVLVLGPAVAQAAVVRAEITWNKANDIDLHAYDDQANHAYYGTPDAIPDAALSSDVTSSGGPETFTDNLDPTDRGVGVATAP